MNKQPSASRQHTIHTNPSRNAAILDEMAACTSVRSVQAKFGLSNTITKAYLSYLPSSVYWAYIRDCKKRRHSG